MGGGDADGDGEGEFRYVLGGGELEVGLAKIGCDVATEWRRRSAFVPTSKGFGFLFSVS